jgi:hypothetical protein
MDLAIQSQRKIKFRKYKSLFIFGIGITASMVFGTLFFSCLQKSHGNNKKYQDKPQAHKFIIELAIPLGSKISKGNTKDVTEHIYRGD